MEQEQAKIKKITAGFIFSWIIGIFFLISSMSAFARGFKVEGIVIVLSALLIIPYFSKVIAEKLHFQVSGGAKIILAIIAFSAYSYSISSPVNNLNESGGKMIGSQDTAITTASPNASSEPVITCPNVVKEASEYDFKYSESEAGNTYLYLSAGFINQMNFSDGFELYNKPDTGNEYIYSSESFVCEKGSEQGQSINKLYCRPTYMYEPMLRRKNIDKDGNVISTDDKEIGNFIFDVTGKDINRVNDLDTLKLESITCK